MAAALIPLMALLFLIPAKTHAQLLTNCGDSNYTAGSPYKSDIAALLANLTSSTAAYFSTSSSGAAYGLAQCLPYATPADCAACHNASAAAIAARCPLAKSAAVRYDGCVLRYSNQPFLSRPGDGPIVILSNTMNASDPAVFNTQVRRLMKDVKAAAAAAKLRFAVGIRSYTEFDSLYGLAWCTQDLSADDCTMCLDGVATYLPYGKLGGRVVAVSCAVRFETYRYFPLSEVSPPPSSPHPDPPATLARSGDDDDPTEGQQLYWERRYKIIEGIGRGLLYLHEDSRLRIIHRDLKASNILLDGDLNPKISDFGLAKLFGIDETQGNTSRIAGTFGYMAPEYAMRGLFSTKSDVFSYGVLVLEIVTGRKNSGFQESSDATDLPSHVWQRWNEGKALEVADPSLGGRFRPQEVLRCIHIGLLCTQDDPTERPNMATVVLMLSSYSVTLPTPYPPAFHNWGITSSESVAAMKKADFDVEGDYYDGEGRLLHEASENGISISELEPR